MDTTQFLDEFVAEAMEHLDAMEADLMALEKQKDAPDQALVNRIFRAMHSIKGAAGFMGLNKIGDLAHAMESPLSMIRAGDIRPETAHIDAFLSGVDQLKKMLEMPLHSNKTDISGIVGGINNALSGNRFPDAAGESDAALQLFGADGEDTGFEIAESALKKLPPEMSVYVLKYDLVQLAETGQESPIALINKLTGMGEIMDARIDAPLDDLREDIANVPLEYDVLYASLSNPKTISDKTGLAEKRIIAVLTENSDAPGSPDAGVIIDLPPGGEELPKDGEQSAKETSQDSRDKMVGRSIRVPEEKLDRIVNIVGELVTVQASLNLEAKMQKKNRGLRAIAENVNRMIGELRDITLGIRMVPIGETFNRYKRLIRDISGEQGREVALITEGGETELDKKLIERLNDPLSHLIRNAIAHGMEPEETRVASGKPKNGTILISADHSGGNVSLRIEDDGAGLDTEAIRTKAVEMGLVKKNAELSEKEIHAIIFTPGFSTAGKVDGVSGRGVGMDVVRRSIESLGGSIDVASDKGIGTAFTLKMPMTLAIIDGLLVKIGTDSFIFPLTLVEKCIILRNDELKTTRKRNMMNFGGEIIPYICLREIFEIDGNAPDLERVVIADTIRGRIGFGVDRVIGNHKTVIKSLGKMYRNVEGVSGASILGDGTAALILDANRLAYLNAMQIG